MVNETIKKVNSFSQKVGIPKMPLVTKRAMKVGTVANAVAGVSLITLGLVSKKKWAIPLGITSIVANSIINSTFDGE